MLRLPRLSTQGEVRALSCTLCLGHALASLEQLVDSHSGSSDRLIDALAVETLTWQGCPLPRLVFSRRDLPCTWRRADELR